MNRVVADYPGWDMHVVLDNLSTHKPKRDLWLARHRNVHFHYTPTHTSWLNQIKIWFSILNGKSLDGASFHSVGELQSTHQQLHRKLQRGRTPVPLDQKQSPPKTPQALFRRSMILGTTIIFALTRLLSSNSSSEIGSAPRLPAAGRLTRACANERQASSGGPTK